MQYKSRLRKPAAGTVLGGLALIVAVAGGSYAVAQTSQPAIVVACQSNKMLFLADPATGQCPTGQARVELTTTAYAGFARADEHAALKQRVADAEAQLAAGAGEHAALKQRVESLEALLAGVTRSGDTLTFGGMNVQIINGLGDTNATGNGLGNLIVGYNSDGGSPHDRSGSHNLVIGDFHDYTSTSGIVAGTFNRLTGYSATVFGFANTASGEFSSVSGGSENTANGNNSSVSGGSQNTANGGYSSILGGSNTTLDGFLELYPAP